MHSKADVSRFYLGNEEVAREIQRLYENGSLTGLLEILDNYSLELRIESVQEEWGLRELLGLLGDTIKQKPSSKRRKLPLFQTTSPDPLLRSAPPWDPLSFLCTRSRFRIVRPNGDVEEVYMPDHICPECYNDHNNKIEGCQRVCALCRFEW